MRALLYFLVLGAAASANAADRVVALTKPLPARPNVAAMPKIVKPKDAAERAINLLLRGLDAKVRLASAPNTNGCAAGFYSRSVQATMQGPGYLSYLVTDQSDCGEHPSVEIRSVVYDLKLGKVVDWSKLLPPAYVGDGNDGPAGADQSPVVAVASKRLYELYLAGYPKEQDADCQQTVRDAGGEHAPPPMVLWLDARGDGLAVRFDLPHAVQACAEVVTIPTDTMRSDRTDASLTDAIDAAHQLIEPK